MVVREEMNFNARDNVDVIDAIKQMKDGVAPSCTINMHEFDDNNESGFKTLMQFKEFIRKNGLDIRFVSFNGTLPRLREYLKKCTQEK